MGAGTGKSSPWQVELGIPVRHGGGGVLGVDRRVSWAGEVMWTSQSCEYFKLWGRQSVPCLEARSVGKGTKAMQCLRHPHHLES